MILTDSHFHLAHLFQTNKSNVFFLATEYSECHRRPKDFNLMPAVHEQKGEPISGMDKGKGVRVCSVNVALSDEKMLISVVSCHPDLKAPADNSWIYLAPVKHAQHYGKKMRRGTFTVDLQ